MGNGETDVERSMQCSMVDLSCSNAGAVRRGDVSVCCPLAGRAALPASREFVRIKSAAAGAIDFVAGALGIRHREVSSAGRSQMHGPEPHR